MYETRIAALRARMAEAGLPALLVGQNTNMLYLSGFRGSAGWLVITPGERLILTDFRYHERVKLEVDAGYELVDISGLQLGADVLPGLARRLGIAQLGFEAEHLTVLQLRQLGAAGLELVPTEGIVEKLREVKEPGEIEKLRRATLLGERIYSELLPLLNSSMSENEVAAEIEYRARRYGASGVSFPPIIASGRNSSRPHHGTGADKLSIGLPLTIDLGVVLDDYCSDMTRTVFLGECPPKWREIYSIVREAKDLAFAAIRPGAAAAAVDKVARDYITERGYGEYFRHGLGHGVGLPFKGGPILHWASKDVLAEGHVASNEPGIYLPGGGGIRIEDLFHVTADGAEYFNELDTELTVL